ncbi:MAG: GNAT family N-acetyltransferase [Planctomycetota bacterium]
MQSPSGKPLIEYRVSSASIRPEQLHGFFEGWPDPPSADEHLQVLRGSDFVIIAVDPDQDFVVGFITAISDGVLSAYLPLLEVLPAYRGRGIGAELVRRMLHGLSHLYMVDLVCDEPLAGFYEKLGMSQVVGMAMRNRRGGPRE